MRPAYGQCPIKIDIVIGARGHNGSGLRGGDIIIQCCAHLGSVVEVSVVNENDPSRRRSSTTAPGR